MLEIGQVTFNKDGLIPVVVQDAATNEVLMLAYMNRESLEKTMETGETWFYSRSRCELWHKGATSGNTQKVKEIRVDCDADALLILAEPAGPACHTGNNSCFYRQFPSEDAAQEQGGSAVLYEVMQTIRDRVEHPVEGSYTNYLFEKGIDKMLKKVGEESAEVIIAAKNRAFDEVQYEVADLMYHVSVVLVEQGLSWDDIFRELKSRQKKDRS